MTSQPEEAHRWQAEIVRLTVFPAEPVDAASGWWERVTGRSPEETASRRQGAVTVETGDLDGCHLVMEANPGRVDWRFSRLQSDEEKTIGIGEFSEATRRFAPVAAKALDLLGSLDRIAFGAVLLSPVDDVREGYRLLAGHLSTSLKVDFETASDLLFRINRSREIPRREGKSMQVNRLATWSVVRRMATGLSISGEQVVRSAAQLLLTAAQLELDINTAPETEFEAQGAEAFDVFEVLTKMAEEIAEKGDVP